MADGDFVPRTELEQRFLALEGRMANVEKASANMQSAQEALTATLHNNSEKLDDIFLWVTKANGLYGFVRKHGPRIGTFVLGVAVARGWVTAENGRNFLHIFGM